MPIPGGTQVGGYTIVRLLAQGGMAEVYLATRVGASGFIKSCVIKRMKAKEKEPTLRRLFENEASWWPTSPTRTSSRSSTSRTTGSGLYLAMEYVDGCSLEELRQRLPMKIVPPFIAAGIVREIAKALAYAWSARPATTGSRLHLVHRDVSPHNILVSRVGDVKLSDFGVAKPVSKETEGMMMGKLQYMAPEQMLPGGKLDQRTDLFGLGIVLYELVTAGGRSTRTIRTSSRRGWRG